jgi:hypothetical protein
MILRNLIISIVLAILAIMQSVTFYRNRRKENSKLYSATILLLLCYSLFITFRAIAWVLYPQDSLFVAGTAHQLYFLFVAVIEVGIGIIWPMMNNQRVEAELLASEINLKSTINDLEEALSKVKTLSGILPICMHCKEIRDDQGYWSQIESFISQNSEAEFSHGICPKCMEEKYPGYLKKE